MSHTALRSRLGCALLLGAQLTGMRCAGASFRDAKLTRAELREADLSGADLRGADLSGALYDARTAWPDGFNPRSHGARAEDGPSGSPR